MSIKPTGNTRCITNLRQGAGNGKGGKDWLRYDKRSLVINGVPTTRWQRVQVLKGYVGLEAEGYAIELKNLRINEL